MPARQTSAALEALRQYLRARLLATLPNGIDDTPPDTQPHIEEMINLIADLVMNQSVLLFKLYFSSSLLAYIPETSHSGIDRATFSLVSLSLFYTCLAAHNRDEHIETLMLNSQIAYCDRLIADYSTSESQESHSWNSLMTFLTEKVGHIGESYYKLYELTDSITSFAIWIKEQLDLESRTVADSAWRIDLPIVTTSITIFSTSPATHHPQGQLPAPPI